MMWRKRVVSAFAVAASLAALATIVEAAAQVISDPTDSVCVAIHDSCFGEVAAVSDGGDADGAVSLSDGGSAGCNRPDSVFVGVAPTGSCAEGGLLGVSLTGTALSSNGLALSGTGPAAGLVAVSGTGSACADTVGVSVAGTGCGFYVAVSGVGPAAGFVAVSGTNSATGQGYPISSPILTAGVSGTGPARGGELAVSGGGSATACGGPEPVAVAVVGTASSNC